jgi:hypothetical protein
MDDLDKKLDELFEKKAAQLRENAELEKMNHIEREQVKSLISEFLRSKVNPALEEVRSKFEKHEVPVTLDLDDPLADPPTAYFPYNSKITIGTDVRSQFSYVIQTNRVREKFSIRAWMSYRDPKTGSYKTKDRPLPEPDVVSKDDIISDVLEGYLEINS